MPLSVRPLLFAACALLLAGACGTPPERPLPQTGVVRGTLEITPGTRGSAWLFLFPTDEGFPLTQALPEEVTAVSDVTLRGGEPRFLFASVPPNAYRLWGFLDTNLDFEPDIDVLGDRGRGIGWRAARRSASSAAVRWRRSSRSASTSATSPRPSPSSPARRT